MVNHVAVAHIGGSGMKTLRNCTLALCVFIVQLTSVAAKPLVTLTTTEYPPYMGQELPGYGVLNQIISAAFAQQGVKVEFIFLPWARALEEAKSGQTDGITGMWYTAERAQWFKFANQLPANQVGFFRRNDRPELTGSMATLAEKRPLVGIVHGYAYPEPFKAAKFRTEAAWDDEANLQLLVRGKVDLVLIDKGLALYLIAKKMPEQTGRLVWVEPAIEIMPLYVAFSHKVKDVDQTVEVFNTGLAAITADGTLKKIMGKYFQQAAAHEPASASTSPAPSNQ
ncbi:substrate-binding periplasmic protein [Chitinimonas sp. BJB300]|uniref:substrate-binding periplasmic protein n=1 Tax=Chitinimonas sp. BJB300 TaxID=1559339 RepID=UPI000C0E3DA8|nr:transporter substrate-binding domain-containing protein [Chitinimonas sp. BJB300]PHV12309.1 amino acid ABC transporter substrate-binding protein [Chitinimonas sp. BJB300]